MFEQEDIYDSDVEADAKELIPTDYIGMNDDQYIAQFLSVDDMCLESPQIEEQHEIEEIP